MTLKKFKIILNDNFQGDRLDEIVSRSPLLQRWPIEILPNHPSQWFIRNYKSDSWVTDDLWGDEWVYVIKSGLCVVAKAIDELEMHRSGLKRYLAGDQHSVKFLFSQLRRKRREHLIDDLKMRKERKQELENRTSQSSLDEYRPLKSRGMALR